MNHLKLPVWYRLVKMTISCDQCGKEVLLKCCVSDHNYYVHVTNGAKDHWSEPDNHDNHDNHGQLHGYYLQGAGGPKSLLIATQRIIY